MHHLISPDLERKQRNVTVGLTWGQGAQGVGANGKSSSAQVLSEPTKLSGEQLVNSYSPQC